MTSSTRNLGLKFLCAALALISLAYLGKGFDYLVRRSDAQLDLHLRWIDEQYVLQRRNPFDIFLAHSGQIPNPPQTTRNSDPIPWIGVPDSAGYPAWSFFAGAAFFWPSWPAARSYWAAFNLAALALQFYWAFRLVRPDGFWEGLTLALGCVALSANCTTIGVGQYGVVFNGFLVACLMLSDAKHDVLAGACLAIALGKPTSTGPFGIPFVVKRRWWTLASIAVYMIVAHAFVWALTSTNPLEMLRQMLLCGSRYSADGYGPINYLIAAGASISKATEITAVFFLACSIILSFLWRHASMLVQFAIASLCARFWGYHRIYDNVVLFFLLVAVGELAMRTRSRLHMGWFLFLGVTLWIPAKLADNRISEWLQYLAWVGGLVVLLAATPRSASITSETEAVPDVAPVPA